MTGEKRMFSSYDKNEDPKELSHSGMEIKVWSKVWVKLLYLLVGVLGPTAHPGLPLKVFSRSRTVSTTVAKWFVPIARETVNKIYRFGPLRDA